MALITCKECGTSISDSAKSCPQCGASIQPGSVTGIDLSSVNFRNDGRGSKSNAPRSDVRAARGETGFVSGFERKILFRIARFVAFTVCFFLFMAMLGGLIYIGATYARMDVPEPAQVVQSLKSDAVGSSSGAQDRRYSTSAPSTLGASSSPLAGMRLPPELQELIANEDNRRILEGWLSELEQEDRQQFLDKLGESARVARASGMDEIKAINSYHDQYKSYLAEREKNRLASTQARLAAAGVVMSILLMLALFSLVLVLLAIERNTYRAASPEASQ